MNNKYIWLVAAVLMTLALAPWVSCGGDDDSTPTDVTDVRDEGGGDTGERCPPQANPDVPEMRLRTLNVTAPAAMQAPILQALINNSMESEDFIWLIRLTGVGTGTITLRTGSGQKTAGTTCTYNFLAPTYPPDEMTMAETGSHFELSGEPIARLDVPLWNSGESYPDPPLMILPLRNLDISGDLSSDRLYIGSFDGGTGRWTDGGDLSGAVTVADARTTIIDALGMSLCGLLSGEAAGPGPSDDCPGDPTTWERPPDTTVGSDPAYAMTATFAASAVHIQGD